MLVIELMKSINKKTCKKRYYKKIGDVMTRISLIEYDKIYGSCVGVNCVFTNSNKRLTRHYTGCVFDDVN
jgi:hypothetical protein